MFFLTDQFIFGVYSLLTIDILIFLFALCLDY
jgi:hypothetical protein